MKWMLLIAIVESFFIYVALEQSPADTEIFPENYDQWDD